MEFSRKKFPRLKDCLPLTSGLFHHMSYTFRNEVTKDQLDYLLMADAAQRNPAPVIDLIYDEAEDETGERKLTSEELTKLAALMLAYYKPRWDKLGDIYDIEYDPIHNYLDEWEDENDGRHADERVLDSDRDDTLNTTVTKTNTRTDNLEEREVRNLTNGNTRTLNNTDATTNGKTNTRTYNNLAEVKSGGHNEQASHDNTDQVKGFNSSNWVDTDHSSGGKAQNETTLTYNNETTTTNGTVTDALSGIDSTLHSGTISDSGTEGGNKTVTNTGTVGDSGSEATTGTNSRDLDETETNSGTDHREREGRHFGNIGNLTSQKMLNEEIELWKWNYVRSILDDAIKFLTLDVYL